MDIRTRVGRNEVVLATMETITAHETVKRALTLSESDIAELAEELEAIIDGDLLFDRPSRLVYATDASIYQMEPITVVFPRHTEDIQAVLHVAQKHGVPVLPRGAGTSLAGQTVNHAIVIDCSRYMANVIEIDPSGLRARVQPGVVLAALNQDVAAHGLRYAIDNASLSRSTIGGGIGNNSCGARSVIYGKTVDQVLSLDVVLADGTITTFSSIEGPLLEEKLALQTLEGEVYRETLRLSREHSEEIDIRFPKVLRRVSGYGLDLIPDDGSIDLTRLIVGSEGTLGIVTEAEVRLVPLPACTGLAVVHFGSVPEAARATLAALEHDPSAVELMDGIAIRRCRESEGYRDLANFVQGDPGALLFIEFQGDTLEQIESTLSQLKTELSKRGFGYATVTASDPELQTQMWNLRQSALGLVMSVRGDTKPLPFVEDGAVEPQKLPEFLERFDGIVRSHGTEAAYYGHASVGCIHIRPMVNVKEEDGLRTMSEISSEIADLTLEFGGSISGEHGDGILRGVHTERMFGPQLTEAFRELKRAFDPQGILNPGKIIDTPAFDQNLRIDPQTRNSEPTTHLDFSAEGGLAGAIEQCDGNAACRRMDGGMCPSFMVTQNEEHSTRGRANLLRMAISGVLPSSELTGRRVFEALDLCVECKACRAECPSSVDMAKIKHELLAQHYEQNGVPLRARLFANIATLSRIGSATAPISNVLGRIRPLRSLMHHLLGVHQERPLPSFQRTNFRSWFAQRSEPTVEAPRGEVVLFDDTFTQFQNVQVGRAATRVLEALGYRVVLVDRNECCGRPAISNGMPDMAREQAQKNVQQLLPYAERGVPIVGTEPSCLLTLRDEYPDLLRDEPLHTASVTVAGKALLMDELIAQLSDDDPSIGDIFREDVTAKILLHGHCHQKAIAGMDPTLTALALAPGYQVDLVDSPCCGMAGSFGFETEHYEISRAMGALKLFPSVQAAPDESVVAITGVSCRQQINHFTSRTPRHVVELLEDALR